MYRFRERHHSHFKFYSTFGVFVLLVVAAAAYGINQLRPDTYVSQTPPPVVTPYDATDPKAVSVSEPLFTLSLPAGWKVRDNNDIPKPAYSWSGTVKEDATRSISLYLDALPQGLAVNRALPVQPKGDSMTIIGNVSDNCTNFTRPTTDDTKAGTAIARWQGTQFVCDIGNNTRDVVGLSTTDGVNGVTLTGPQAGRHQVYMAYTDNSASPDYTIFVDVLKSFQLK